MTYKNNPSSILERATAFITAGIFACTSLCGLPVSQAEAASLTASVCADTFVKTLPSKTAIVEECYIPEGAKDSTPFIIHIQDAHCNYEAQQHIATILRSFVSYYHSINGDMAMGQPVVAVEGTSYGSIDTAPLSWFPEKQETEAVCNQLMKEGRISGMEYLHATEKSFLYYGLEEKGTYEEGRTAYLHALKNRGSALEVIDRVIEALEQLRTSLYSAEFLKVLEGEALLHGVGQGDHRSQAQPLTEYFSFLGSCAVKYGISLQSLKNLAQLYELQRSMGTINPDTVQKELANVATVYHIKELQNGLSASSDIEDILQSYQVDLRRYPSLFKHIKFMSFFRSLEYGKILVEVRSLEKTLAETMLYTKEQKKLYQFDHFMRLLRNLALLTLSSEEEQEIGNYSSRTISALAQYLSKHSISKQMKETEIEILKSVISYKDSFYKNAGKRDEVIMNNLARLMKDVPRPMYVLVTGGYHAARIHEIMKEKNYGYVSLIPMLSSSDREATEIKYHRALQGTMDPLAQSLYDALTQVGVTPEQLQKIQQVMSLPQGSAPMKNLALEALSAADPVRAFAETVGTEISVTQDVMNALRTEGKVDNLSVLAQSMVTRINDALTSVAGATVRIVLDEVSGSFTLVSPRGSQSIVPSVSLLESQAQQVKETNPQEYQRIVRTLIVLAVETPDAPILQAAKDALQNLGEATDDELQLLDTMRNKEENIQRIASGEIKTAVVMGIGADPHRSILFNAIYGARNKGQNTLMGRAQNVTLYPPPTGSKNHLGSGFGVFRVEAQRRAAGFSLDVKPGETAVYVDALNGGAGTRSALETVSSYMTKGQIPTMSGRTLIEQGMEQIAEIIGGKKDGLPAGEWVFVVPADNILMPAPTVGNDFQNSGQSAFLFAPRKKILGATFSEINGLPDLGMLFLAAGRRVKEFKEKPDMATLIKMTVQNGAELNFGSVKNLVDALTAIPAIKAVTDQHPDMLQHPELLLIAPLMFGEDVKNGLPTHKSAKGSQTLAGIGGQPAWDNAFDALRSLQNNADVVTVLNKLRENEGDYAYANTFYFLLSKPVMDTLFGLLSEPTQARLTDVPSKADFDKHLGEGAWEARQKEIAVTSYWKRPMRIVGFDAKSNPLYEGKAAEVFDWSSIVLVPPTLTRDQWMALYEPTMKKHKLSAGEFYSDKDWENIRLIILEALKVGLQPSLETRKQEFITKLSVVDAQIATTYGDTYFDVLAKDRGLLQGKESLGVATDDEFNAIREAAIKALKEMGLSFIGANFGDKWADAGNPTESRDLAYATVKGDREILKMAYRMHFGLPATTKDIVGAVLKGTVIPQGTHLISNAVIEVPEGVTVKLGNNVVIANSYVKIEAAPGTTVTIADGVVINMSRITISGEKLEQIAQAEGVMIENYMDGGVNDAAIEIKADHVYGTVYVKATGEQRTVTHHKDINLKDKAVLTSPETLVGLNTSKTKYSFDDLFQGNGQGGWNILEYAKMQTAQENLADYIATEKKNNGVSYLPAHVGEESSQEKVIATATINASGKPVLTDADITHHEPGVIGATIIERMNKAFAQYQTLRNASPDLCNPLQGSLVFKQGNVHYAAYQGDAKVTELYYRLLVKQPGDTEQSIINRIIFALRHEADEAAISDHELIVIRDMNFLRTLPEEEVLQLLSPDAFALYRDNYLTMKKAEEQFAVLMNAAIPQETIGTKPYNAMILFGSPDMKTPEAAAELILKNPNQFTHIFVVGGGNGKVTEAVQYRDIMVKKGVPVSRIVIPQEDLAVETGSKTYAENFLYLKNMLKSMGINESELERILVVQNPYSVKRAEILTRQYLPATKERVCFSYDPRTTSGDLFGTKNFELAWQLKQLETSLFEENAHVVSDDERAAFRALDANADTLYAYQRTKRQKFAKTFAPMNTVPATVRYSERSIKELTVYAVACKDVVPAEYQSVIRTLVVLVVTQSDAQVVDAAKSALQQLGEATDDELLLLDTMRNKEANIKRIESGDIKTAVVMGIGGNPNRKNLFDRIYGARNNGQESLLGKAQKMELYPPPVGGKNHLGSGFGVFRVEKQRRDAGFALDVNPGETAIYIDALNGGAGTRSAVETVASYMTKGQIPIFGRTLIEQGMEQIAEITGDKTNGLPAGEWVFVVPADNILMPAPTVGNDFQKSGQSAFLFAPKKKVLGATFAELNGLPDLGMLFLAVGRRVKEFKEKPDMATLIKMTVQNGAELNFGSVQNLMNALTSIPAIKAVTDQHPDMLQHPELLLIAPLMFGIDVQSGLPKHKSVVNDPETFNAIGAQEAWDRAFDALRSLQNNADVITILNRLREQEGDCAYANTFYFLLSKPVMDTLFTLLSEPTAAKVTDVPSKADFDKHLGEGAWEARQKEIAASSYWKRPMKILGFDADNKPMYQEKPAEVFDWSSIVLVPPTLTRNEWMALYASTMKKHKLTAGEFYSVKDWENIRLIILESLKVGLQPNLATREAEFIKNLSAIDSTIAAKYGKAYFEVLSSERGLLKDKSSIGVTSTFVFNRIREASIKALKEMGLSFIGANFGDKWADAGNPTESRDLSYATVKGEREIVKMAYRMHFGLPMTGDDVVDSVVKGKIVPAENYLIYNSVIEVPEGVTLELGNNVVISNSYVKIEAEAGETVRIADGVVISTARITLSEKKLNEIAQATGFMVENYFDGGVNDAAIDIKADHVYGTVYVKATGEQRTVTHHKDINLKNKTVLKSPETLVGLNTENTKYSFDDLFTGNGQGGWNILEYDKMQSSQDLLAQDIAREKEEKTHITKSDIENGYITYAMIKPDVFRDSVNYEHIIQDIERAGFEVLVRGQERVLTREEAAEFYANKNTETWFSVLLDRMTSGPVIPLILRKRGADAVNDFRTLLGPTDASLPGSLRNVYGGNVRFNRIHGADSRVNALREIQIVFAPEELRLASMPDVLTTYFSPEQLIPTIADVYVTNARSRVVRNVLIAETVADRIEASLAGKGDFSEDSARKIYEQLKMSKNVTVFIYAGAHKAYPLLSQYVHLVVTGDDKTFAATAEDIRGQMLSEGLNIADLRLIADTFDSEVMKNKEGWYFSLTDEKEDTIPGAAEVVLPIAMQYEGADMNSLKGNNKLFYSTQNPFMMKVNMECLTSYMVAAGSFVAVELAEKIAAAIAENAAHRKFEEAA